jgi:hypothetical protein
MIHIYGAWEPLSSGHSSRDDVFATLAEPPLSRVSSFQFVRFNVVSNRAVPALVVNVAIFGEAGNGLLARHPSNLQT